MTDGTAGIGELIDLKGRSAFVTGGGRGIGAAIAARLVEAGADVTIGDIDPASHSTATAMGAGFAICDVTDPASLHGALDQASGVDDTLQILVNNAGIFPTTGSMLDATDEFIARMLDVNVRAHFSVARRGRSSNGERWRDRQPGLDRCARSRPEHLGVRGVEGRRRVTRRARSHTSSAHAGSESMRSRRE